MARYIDADEFEKRIKPYDTDDRIDKAMYIFAHNMMMSTSTADVVERKRGKWIRENIVLTSNPPQYQWHCSECGRIKHWFTDGVLTNFCPNCGAEMEGEKDERAMG